MLWLRSLYSSAWRREKLRGDLQKAAFKWNTKQACFVLLQKAKPKLNSYYKKDELDTKMLVVRTSHTVNKDAWFNCSLHIEMD